MARCFYRACSVRIDGKNSGAQTDSTKTCHGPQPQLNMYHGLDFSKIHNVVCVISLWWRNVRNWRARPPIFYLDMGVKIHIWCKILSIFGWISDLASLGWVSSSLPSKKNQDYLWAWIIFAARGSRIFSPNIEKRALEEKATEMIEASDFRLATQNNFIF